MSLLKNAREPRLLHQPVQDFLRQLVENIPSILVPTQIVLMAPMNRLVMVFTPILWLLNEKGSLDGSYCADFFTFSRNGISGFLCSSVFLLSYFKILTPQGK